MHQLQGILAIGQLPVQLGLDHDCVGDGLAGRIDRGNGHQAGTHTHKFQSQIAVFIDAGNRHGRIVGNRGQRRADLQNAVLRDLASSDAAHRTGQTIHIQCQLLHGLAQGHRQNLGGIVTAIKLVVQTKIDRFAGFQIKEHAVTAVYDRFFQPFAAAVHIGFPHKRPVRTVFIKGIRGQVHHICACRFRSKDEIAGFPLGNGYRIISYGQNCGIRDNNIDAGAGAGVRVGNGNHTGTLTNEVELTLQALYGLASGNGFIGGTPDQVRMDGRSRADPKGYGQGIALQAYHCGIQINYQAVCRCGGAQQEAELCFLIIRIGHFQNISYARLHFKQVAATGIRCGVSTHRDRLAAVCAEVQTDQSVLVLIPILRQYIFAAFGGSKDIPHRFSGFSVPGDELILRDGGQVLNDNADRILILGNIDPESVSDSPNQIRIIQLVATVMHIKLVKCANARVGNLGVQNKVVPAICLRCEVKNTILVICQFQRIGGVQFLRIHRGDHPQNSRRGK